MLTEIVNYLELSNVGERDFIFVTNDAISDKNFVISEILAHYFKNKYTVVLLNFVQSYAHYNHVLLKSGINVRQLRENQQLITIDGLSEIEKLANSATCESELTEAFQNLFSITGDECVRKLYTFIQEIVHKLRDESKQFVLFIDDISALLNLGIDLKSIFVLVQYIRTLCSNGKDSYNMLLIGSMHEKSDPENSRLVNYLLHLADIKIQVEGLKTGYSSDINGKINLSVRSKLDGTFSDQKFLFKVSEEGAKLVSAAL